ncbi:S9 family peptidase [Thalassotalea piscium]|uniref:Dipeptidyl aminopeptidase/acylaminoacyl peptidase n=1 Tax=Thalassotalea piscium TaxID=1230533 RepID=A0A7X0NIW5_9GAMM|nr:DPP IV N-terminal domain-containing protein [Thalassotalea piscium]MBB6544264.1 dipeptidyl aminopeptidase/acylaminoacyl peptidase [Thalassotalea piscium]
MNKLLVMLLGMLVLGCQLSPASTSIKAANIERAQLFSPENLKGKVHNLSITPHWINNKDHFWFERYSSENGQEFVLVSSESKQALFEQTLLKHALKPFIEIDWRTKPLDQVSFDGNMLSFAIEKDKYTCAINTKPYSCLLNNSVDKPVAKYLSPNNQHYVKVVDYNLYLCSAETSTCKQMTDDGSESEPYAVKHPYPEALLANSNYEPQDNLQVYWSDDSKYLISYKLFRSGVNKLTLTDSVSDNGFSVNTVSYYYPKAGDSILPNAQIYLIDTVAQQGKLLDAPKIMQTYYGGAIWGEWHNNDFYYHDRRRGNREYHLRKVIAKEARVISLIKETDEEFIDPWVQTFKNLTQSEQVIWSSQRSGYQHLYLYDANNGALINPITKGQYTVRDIKGVDEEKGVLYFEASGKEANEDPYVRHLYRINLDGSNLKLLTPEPLEHSAIISPNYNYIIDSYSDPSTPTQSWLRDASTGKKLLKLDQADISELTAIGWQPPEPFTVLADDGKTPLYGLIYKPSNFNDKKSYPIIDDTYTGPHNFFTPKSFNTYTNQRPALAELGFIVIKMDGRGTNKRGKAFHRHSYKNLAAGTDDHVWAIQQLAKKRPYFDLSRVGIFGFSAGGYDTMQAMLRHNNFFKAGVSASGNHDFRVDKSGWNEIWMGWPETEHWDQQSNYTNVERLKGKLLLAHGELDSNVHPSATLRLVDKLIKANKEFDLLIMPKMGHVLDNSPYFVEKRWRFFIEHLQP